MDICKAVYVLHVCVVITHFVQQCITMINRLPTCSSAEQRGKLIFPCPRSRLRIWSRKAGSAVLSRVSLIILHTQSESDACYTRNRVSPISAISPEFVGSRNCVPMALTAKTPPAQDQYGSQVSFSSGCYQSLQVTFGPIILILSFAYCCLVCLVYLLRYAPCE